MLLDELARLLMIIKIVTNIGINAKNQLARATIYSSKIKTLQLKLAKLSTLVFGNP